MNIITFFTDNGVSKTGLTPKIDIYKLDGTHVITAANMTEVGDGFYYYDFVTYDDTIDYCFKTDGGVALTGSERYTFGTNEVGQVNSAIQLVQTDVTFLKNIEGGMWKVYNNQMIFYKSDNSTEVCRFNLYDISGNPSVTNIFKRTRV